MGKLASNRGPSLESSFMFSICRPPAAVVSKFNNAHIIIITLTQWRPSAAIKSLEPSAEFRPGHGRRSNASGAARPRIDFKNRLITSLSEPVGIRLGPLARGAPRNGVGPDNLTRSTSPNYIFLMRRCRAWHCHVNLRQDMMSLLQCWRVGVL